MSTFKLVLTAPDGGVILEREFKRVPYHLYGIRSTDDVGNEVWDAVMAYKTMMKEQEEEK
jgi:hypothetical protein